MPPPGTSGHCRAAAGLPLALAPAGRAVRHKLSRSAHTRRRRGGGRPALSLTVTRRLPRPAGAVSAAAVAWPRGLLMGPPVDSEVPRNRHFSSTRTRSPAPSRPLSAAGGGAAAAGLAAAGPGPSSSAARDAIE
jgi:hypothetical protein